MEALSATLQPYKNLVGSLASILTILQIFAGGFICKDIYYKKGTAGISSLPFVGGLVISLLMLKYAYLLQETAMLVVNVAAIALNFLYLVFYYIYSENKHSEVHLPLSCGTALIAVLLGYSVWEDTELVEYRFGMIVTVLMFILMGSPLMGLRTIIKNKDASSIPFPLTFGGTIVSLLWLLYGIILLNNFMIVQNVVGLVLCGSQLILCWMYPEKQQSLKKD